MRTHLRHYTPPPEETWFYKVKDAAGEVIYVGITCHPRLRFQEHRIYARWWREAVSVAWLRFDTRLEALAAERHYLRNLRQRPRFNLASGQVSDAHTIPDRLM